MVTIKTIDNKLKEMLVLEKNLQNKLNNPIFKEIVSRNAYYKDKSFELETLNDAVLENKVRVTYLQLGLLNKINQSKLLINQSELISLLIDSDIKTIVDNLDKYKEKYNYANSVCDLIIDLELLASQELELDRPFETTSYAKLVSTVHLIILNDIVRCYKNSNCKDVENDVIILYFNSLDKSERVNVLKIFCMLSYEKNAFNHFTMTDALRKLMLELNIININAIAPKYKKQCVLISRMLISNYCDYPIEQILDDFTQIKQEVKIKKK